MNWFLLWLRAVFWNQYGLSFCSGLAKSYSAWLFSFTQGNTALDQRKGKCLFPHSNSCSGCPRDEVYFKTEPDTQGIVAWTSSAAGGAFPYRGAGFSASKGQALRYCSLGWPLTLASPPHLHLLGTRGDIRIIWPKQEITSVLCLQEEKFLSLLRLTLDCNQVRPVPLNRRNRGSTLFKENVLHNLSSFRHSAYRRSRLKMEPVKSEL